MGVFLGTDQDPSTFTLLTLLEGLGLLVNLEYVFGGVNMMSPKSLLFLQIGLVV